MKSKILFLTDYYYPNPTSIGVCDNAVIKQLEKRDCCVDVLCFGPKNSLQPINISESVRVFFVRDRLWENIKKANDSKTFSVLGAIICRLYQFLFIKDFPKTSNSVPRRFTELADKLMKENKYEKVVSSYAPFEATYAGYELRRKYPDLEWSMYILDTFTNRGKSKFFSEEWNFKHGWRWEKIFFPVADKIIILKCHEQHHMKSIYDEFREKIHVVDIPLFDMHKFDDVKIELHEGKEFVYTGRIDSHWYSPVEICKLFEKISVGKEWHLHFYGNPTDCESYLDAENKKTEGKIIKEGFVTRKEVESVLANADILVSFWHKDSAKVQSKIFDYMSSGKKIIHLTDSTVRDSARDYYVKYPNAFLIEPDDMNNEVKIKSLIQFIEQDSFLDMQQVEELFTQNTPDLTAEIILR